MDLRGAGTTSPKPSWCTSLVPGCTSVFVQCSMLHSPLRGLSCPYFELPSILKHLFLVYIFSSMLGMSSLNSLCSLATNALPCTGDCSRYLSDVVMTCRLCLVCDDASSSTCCTLMPMDVNTLCSISLSCIHAFLTSPSSKSQNRWHGASLMTS